MKNLLMYLIFFFIAKTNAQNRYNSDVQYVKNKYRFYDSVVCINSEAIVKAEYYIDNNIGYAIIYFKRGYDVVGTPYLYCNIPLEVWNNFKNYGVTSWGNSYNSYIKSYSCSAVLKNIENTAYRIQSPQESVNLELLKKVLEKSELSYNNNISTYNQYFENKKQKFNYNYSKVQDLIVELRNQINESNFDAKLIENIRDNFNKNYLEIFYKKKPDLSSNTKTKKTLKWLTKGFQKVVKEESDNFKKN